MRMIGIGLMAFFIAWAVFVLSSHKIPQRGLRHLSEMMLGPQLIFETEPHNSVKTGQNEQVFFRTTRDAPIILSGFPSYQSAAFLLPIDARAASGYLQIDITTQVLEDVSGVFRVSINNTKRGEMLLYPGEVGRSLRVPLTSDELAKERLVASFSLLGSYDANSCRTKNGIQAIAEIEATSGLYLNLYDELSTPRDQVLANGRVISINWDNSLSLPQKSKLLELGSALLRDSEKVVFKANTATEHLSLSDLQRLDETLPQYEKKLLQWPYHVARKGSNFGLRRFYQTTNWRIKYRPSQFVERILPSVFDLNLTFSGMSNRSGWLISVTLNGSLIHSQVLSSDISTYQASILLPKDDQSASNLIEVTLDSSEEHDGICNEGPVLLAQMEEDTVLLGGATSIGSDLHELQVAFSDFKQTNIIGIDDITNNQASYLSNMIALAIPKSIEINSTNQDANIIFIQRNQFSANEELFDERYQQWMLHLTEADELVVSKLRNKQSSHLVGEKLFSDLVLVNLPRLRGGK